MTELTYSKLLNKTLELYLQKDYKQAYDFITENAMKVQGNNAQIYNFRYSIASKAGLYELAMDIMREAVIDKGYWYSYDYLMGDDDLKPLYKYDDFNELANTCKERELQAKMLSKPDLRVLISDKNAQKMLPLVIALHGNQQNIMETENYWNTCAMNEYILALPQSSQIGFSGAYSWNDVKKGADELKEHYRAVLNEYEVDSQKIIAGGFSAGARTALYAVLNDIIQVTGLILVGPWLPEIAEWEPLMDELSLKGIKSYIICGDKDEDCIEGAKRLVEMMNQRNMPNVFKLIEGLNHDYPVSFDKELEEALKFIAD